MRVSSSTQWAWGTSSHWQLYYTLKRFSKRWLGTVALSSKGYDNDVVDVTRGNRPSSSSRTTNERRKKNLELRLSSSRSFVNSSFGEVLSDEEVNSKLWENEKNIPINNNIVSSCVINQLPSNQPNEDQIFITKSPYDNGLLCGILDGHGGNAFAEYVKTRLPYYLHVALIDKRCIALHQRIKVENLFQNLLETNQDNLYNPAWIKNLESHLTDIQYSVDSISDSPGSSIKSYISNPLRQLFGTTLLGNYELTPNDLEIGLAIKEAFLKLDEDIISEIKQSTPLNSEVTNVALSGCCALIAYLINDEITLANLGDCRAVLGSYGNNEWQTVQLTQDHTAVHNPDEVKRILSEHPKEERWSCIQYGRLLGRLAPLRAFGDIQFKLTSPELNKIFSSLPRYNPMRSLKTPPYLTAEPEIFNYKFEKDDRFIVLASDGLWDMLSNEEVVELVAAYIEGKSIDMMKQTAHLYGVAHCDEILSDPNAFSDTSGENVASFLIRFALGGYDRNNIKSMMSLSYPEVRMYRDDISVTVIFLNQEDDSLP